jgi:hypothetical protein
MTDGDTSLDEKRVYGDATGATELAVACDLGVAVVAVSADIVGEFSLAHRCQARDVAAGPASLAVATAETVLVGVGGEFEPTEFGPAVAVGFDGEALLAAGPDGAVARRDGRAWTGLGALDAVRAIDGDLVAAAGGVYRATDDGLDHVGLSDVRDVAVGGTPLAATADGCYYLGPGWDRALDGAFEAVAGSARRGHAATADALYAADGERWGPSDTWDDLAVPVDGPLADVAHGDGVYAVTDAGTLLVDVGDGWRTRRLGLPGVSGLAVAPE